jgi:hypothetical protein
MGPPITGYRIPNSDFILFIADDFVYDKISSGRRKIWHVPKNVTYLTIDGRKQRETQISFSFIQGINTNHVV